MKNKEIVGKKYGRLLIKDYKRINNKSYFLCVCDCGNEKYIDCYNVRTGHTQSCGCFHQEKLIKDHTTHGLSETRLYGIWCRMIDRCYREKCKCYKNYGGRGIKVCDEWRNDFMAFYNWAMTNGYNDTLSIDRIDVNGNYEPSNCRWATIEMQANNKRTNRFITYKGETLTVSQWERKLGCNNGFISNRLAKGWDEEKALSTPYIRRKEK